MNERSNQSTICPICNGLYEKPGSAMCGSRHQTTFRHVCQICNGYLDAPGSVMCGHRHQSNQTQAGSGEVSVPLESERQTKVDPVVQDIQAKTKFDIFGIIRNFS